MSCISEWETLSLDQRNAIATGIAALLEDRSFLGIERDGRYVDIAYARRPLGRNLRHRRGTAMKGPAVPRNSTNERRSEERRQ